MQNQYQEIQHLNQLAEGGRWIGELAEKELPEKINNYILTSFFELEPAERYEAFNELGITHKEVETACDKEEADAYATWIYLTEK